MQNSQSPNNDFGDWVGQNKGFIAVNANYRLGLFVFILCHRLNPAHRFPSYSLGFWNGEGAQYEGETANVGLLDGRFAVDWVKANIAVRPFLCPPVPQPQRFRSSSLLLPSSFPLLFH
jgi:carboxylesterase type B